MIPIPITEKMFVWENNLWVGVDTVKFEEASVNPIANAKGIIMNKSQYKN